MEVAKQYIELIKNAREAEKDGDMDLAIELYEKAIKQKPVLEQPYDRLMVLYRKEKEYNKEIKVINKGLDVFTETYDKKKAVFSGSGKIAQLSKAILKAVGGKKGDHNLYPEPIPKWLKRKTTVEKKIK
jgi:tetratricopeptide (TPR) repeat protein